jgi:hypothetical protein
VLGAVLDFTDYATMFGVAAVIVVVGGVGWGVWDRKVVPPRRG